MADPRNTISLDTLHPDFATFAIDDATITYSATSVEASGIGGNGSAAVGLAVTLSDGGVIALAADAEFVLGKLIKVESDGKATVQIGGTCSLPGGTAATVTLGKGVVGALLGAAKGYIRATNTAVAAEIGVSNGKVLDETTSTANIVRF